MKRTFMIGVAAGALLAGVNFATAQGGANIEQKGAVQKDQGGAQMKTQGNSQMKAQGGAELKAQGGAELKGSKARAQAPADTKAGSEMKAQDTPKSGAQPKAGTSAQGDTKSPTAGTSAQGDTKAGGSATTGQAGAGAKASLTAEQRTKVRETVFKSGPRVTNVNFSLSVGTVVPRTVRFAPLPLVLVEVYPQWRGYDYFIVEEEIVIIEPRTLKIVAVIRV